MRLFILLLFFCFVDIVGQEREALSVHSAACLGRLDWFDHVMSQSIQSIDCIDENGFTPLMWACYADKTELALHIMKKYKASPCYRSRLGHSAILFAAQNSNFELLVSLALHGANICDKDLLGNTVMHYAASSGRLDLMEFLLDYGVNPDIQNNKGYYPIDYASMYGHIGVFELLASYVRLVPNSRFSVEEKMHDTSLEDLNPNALQYFNVGI